MPHQRHLSALRSADLYLHMHAARDRGHFGPLGRAGTAELFLRSRRGDHGGVPRFAACGWIAVAMALFFIVAVIVVGKVRLGRFMGVAREASVATIGDTVMWG